MNGRVSVVLLALLAGLCIGGGAAFFYCGRAADSVGGVPRDLWAGELVKRTIAVTNGPWGEMQYWYSVIEMHPSLVQNRLSPPARDAWYVGVNNTEALLAFLKPSGLSDRECAELQIGAETNGPAMTLYPSDEFILGLKREVRGRLYPSLGRWQQNEAQSLAVRFVPEGQMNWVDRTDLPRAMAREVKNLIYDHGEVNLFADFNTVLRRSTNAMDKIQFLRVISRQAIVMARIAVGSDENLAPLQAYWNRGDRDQDIQSILESARLSEGRGEVPVDMLLPRFARERLYRYRHSYDPELSNCHYSSLNFFEDVPLLAYTNLAVCSERIMRDYTPVQGEPQLGDIVMFMRNNEEVVHTCNYVAGDIVFTKNGSAVGQPWRLARLPNLVKIYSVSDPISLRYIRQRGR